MDPLLKLLKKMEKKKLCYVCGGKVDLRRDYRLSDWFIKMANVSKPFRYIHRDCYKKFEKEIEEIMR